MSSLGPDSNAVEKLNAFTCFSHPGRKYFPCFFIAVFSLSNAKYFRRGYLLFDCFGRMDKAFELQIHVFYTCVVKYLQLVSCSFVNVLNEVSGSILAEMERVAVLLLSAASAAVCLFIASISPLIMSITLSPALFLSQSAPGLASNVSLR